MAFNIIVAFIIFVSLGASHGQSLSNSQVEPLGKWFVVAVGNYNTTLPAPTCWTMEISGPFNFHNYRGKSTVYNSKTSARHDMSFNITVRGTAGVTGYEKKIFSVLVSYGVNETIFLSSVAFVTYTDDASGVRVIEIRDPAEFTHFKSLFISRNSKLPNDYPYYVGNGMPIENLDCPQDEADTRLL